MAKMRPRPVGRMIRRSRPQLRRLQYNVIDHDILSTTSLLQRAAFVLMRVEGIGDFFQYTVWCCPEECDATL